jgi:hypothetical protein
MITAEEVRPPEVLGEEREVRFLGSADIDGAPISYVIVLSTVITVFSFIPFSVALAAGNGFPMSQGLYPLMGWLLGPWAGAVAVGAGSLVGIFLAPHTAGIPWISVGGAITGPLFASALAPGLWRRALWLVLIALVAIEVGLFYHRAIVLNGISPSLFLESYTSEMVGIALFILPTRSWIARLIGSADIKRLALGLFLGTWCCTALTMMGESIAAYTLINWPKEVFVMFIPIIPLETCTRSAIGAVIGTGVIAGLRTMALVKPPNAIY